MTVSRRTGAAAVALLAATLLAGCGNEGKGSPAWTVEPSGGSASPGATTAGTAAPSATGSSAPSAQPGTTASAWKVFTDPAKKVSFDLPQEWIAQSVEPDKGTLPGAVKVEVKDAEGTYLATLQTGLPEAAPGRVRRGLQEVLRGGQQCAGGTAAQRRRGHDFPACGVPGDPGLPVLRLLRDHECGGRSRLQGVPAAERGPRAWKARATTPSATCGP